MRRLHCDSISFCPSTVWAKCSALLQYVLFYVSQFYTLSDSVDPFFYVDAVVWSCVVLFGVVPYCLIVVCIDLKNNYKLRSKKTTGYKTEWMFLLIVCVCVSFCLLCFALFCFV